jgi:dolichol-phosphate mannosyltransferase
LLRHAVRSGQSAAVATGVRAARAPLIATLDGDGQNDPADIPRLLEALKGSTSGRLRLVMGNRTTRRDSWLRRLSSRVANGVRSRLLHDGTPDTGCGLKVFDRAVFLDMPRFDHMHRFMPALFRREGYEVISVPVNHRQRTRGTSKYGLHNRLWVGIVDLAGVSWLLRRASPRIRVAEDE